MSFGKSMTPSGAVVFQAFGDAGPLSYAIAYGGAPDGEKRTITPRMSFGKSTTPSGGPPPPPAGS